MSYINILYLKRLDFYVLVPLLATASIQKSLFSVRLPHIKHIKIVFRLEREANNGASTVRQRRLDRNGHSSVIFPSLKPDGI